MGRNLTNAELITHLINEACDLLEASGDMPVPFGGGMARVDAENPDTTVVQLFYPDHTRECEETSEDEDDCTCGERKPLSLRLTVALVKEG